VQFVWSPAEFTPAVINVATDQTLDFGYVSEGAPHFVPRLAVLLNDFQGLVAANNAFRFSLEVCAEGYRAKKYQVFEVAWDGKWSTNLDEMAQHLRINEIESSNSPTTIV
jgi:hypothetical protein